MTAVVDTPAARDSGRYSFNEELVQLMPSLKAFARSLCHNPVQADDLVQDCLTKALSHKESFEPGTNLRAWLFTILRNHYYSQLRKNKREVEDTEGKFAARLSSREEQSGVVDLEDFKRAFSLLPPDHREVLTLVGMNGTSYEEAAEIMGCACGTVKSRVNRARKKLADLLGEPNRDLFNDEDDWQPDARISTRHHNAVAELQKQQPTRPQLATRSKEPVPDPTEVDRYWKMLVESGALEAEPSLSDLKRRKS